MYRNVTLDIVKIPPKFLIVQLGQIGDMILMSPIFSAIKKKFPDSEIHVLSGRKNPWSIKNHSAVSKIYTYRKTPYKIIRLIYFLRKEHYDFWIDPKDHYSGESKIFCKLSGAKKKIGFNKTGDHTFHIVLPSNNQNKGKHFIDRCFNSLIHIGINKPDSMPMPELFVDIDSEIYTNNFIKPICGKPNIVINVSASNDDRIWTSEKWIDVINALDSGKYNFIISFVDKERNIANEIVKFSKGALLFKSRNMHDIISLVRSSCLVITPDTSLVHVSSAFNVPVIVLYVTNEENYSKFKPLSEVSYPIFPDKASGTIKNIEAWQVIAAFNNFQLKF